MVWLVTGSTDLALIVGIQRRATEGKPRGKMHVHDSFQP